jgi:hypothetical protein
MTQRPLPLFLWKSRRSAPEMQRFKRVMAYAASLSVTGQAKRFYDQFR